MSTQAQTHLLSELQRVINYAIDEYEVSHAEVVGCLTMLAQGIGASALKKDTETEDAS